VKQRVELKSSKNPYRNKGNLDKLASKS